MVPGVGEGTKSIYFSSKELMLYRIQGNHFVLEMVLIEPGMKIIVSFKGPLS